VSHRQVLQKKLQGFNYQEDRLFAFTKDDVTSFPCKQEQEFFSQFLASSKFLGADPFLRLAFAKRTRNLMFIIRETALCSEELHDISPGFVQSWCAKELLELVAQVDLRSIHGQARPPEVDAGSGAKPLVLIVDDDKGFVDTLTIFLGNEGCGVVTASNGAEAMEKIRLEKPSLILLDLLMPEMDGFQVLEKLKQDSTLNTIPVIVLSGIEEQVERARATDLGANAFIEKGTGFSFRELSKYTRSLLRRPNVA
jgi:CheY-like chemotaxis protein